MRFEPESLGGSTAESQTWGFSGESGGIELCGWWDSGADRPKGSTIGQHGDPGA